MKLLRTRAIEALQIPSSHNAFFVRDDLASDLNERTAEEVFVTGRYCDTRGDSGQLGYVRGHHDRLALIAHHPVVDVTTGKTVSIGDVTIDP